MAMTEGMCCVPNGGFHGQLNGLCRSCLKCLFVPGDITKGCKFLNCFSHISIRCASLFRGAAVLSVNGQLLPYE